MAAMAGAWIAVVAGFGGMRTCDGTLSFAPRLPETLTRIAFRLQWRGRRLRVIIGRSEATYELTDGGPLELSHHGEPFTAAAGEPVTLPISPLHPAERPEQPRGREPISRRRT